MVLTVTFINIHNRQNWISIADPAQTPKFQVRQSDMGGGVGANIKEVLSGVVNNAN